MTRVAFGLILIVGVFVSVSKSDDQLRCCMKGLKRMKNIIICPAPCCPGYHEEVAEPPSLSPVVWCQRDKETLPNRKTDENSIFRYGAFP